MSKKEYYQKNKDKWKKYYETRNKYFSKEKKEYSKKYKKENPEKTKIQKKKDDKKYYEKIKNTPEFKLHRKLYAKEYNSKPTNKERTKQVRNKYYTNPKVKKHRAVYNKKFHQENPELVLRNTRNHLNRLGKYHDLKWHQFLDQLRGWSEIIHKDCKETCQVCFEPSQEAHHVLHKSKYPQLAFNRNNGIALCKKCHNESHGQILITNVQ